MNWLKKIFRKERVLFADLDGTLIETQSGETFPKSAYDWKYKDGIIKAIRKYNPTHLFIVTNQGGVEKGYFSKNDFFLKMSHVIGSLSLDLPNTIVDYNVCFNNDKCDRRRKPNTGMLEDYYHDYINNYDFNKRRAIMIGDASGLEGQFSDSDYMCAKNFGIKYIDVSYFIRWGNPCSFCDCNSPEKCKYDQDMSIVSSFLCNADIELDDWIDKFVSDYERGLSENN